METDLGPVLYVIRYELQHVAQSWISRMLTALSYKNIVCLYVCILAVLDM